MSKMTDRIELSEAIRSILGEDGREKENCHVDSTSVLHPTENAVLQHTTWGPRHAPGKGSTKLGNARQKRPSSMEPDFKSPPKKRRHINEVIILRNPRRKSKSSPEASTGSLLKRTINGEQEGSRSQTARRHTQPACTNQNLVCDSQRSQDNSPESSDSSQGPDCEAFECKRKQDLKSDMGDQSVKATGDKHDDPAKQQEWPVKRKPGDDSLTNITWLRRMAAPDLDPQTLKTTKESDSRQERPPYSYSTLIQFALSTAPSGRMTLREIYHWIETRFPYFRTAKLGWRNSIRHNLSLHKIFIREPPVGHGQPAFWTLRPGTIVRLPEKTMFVARNKSSHRSSSTTESHKAKSGRSKMSSDSHRREKDDKKKKEPYILPRVTQPLALVPVPIFLTTERGTTLVTSPATGEPILSPIPMNLLPEAQLRSMFPSSQERPGTKKMVKIAPKMTVSGPCIKHETSMNSSLTLQTNYPNATFSCNSVLRDSGISTDGEGTFQDSQTASSSQQSVFGASPPNQKHLPIKKRGSPWNGIASSTPNLRMKAAEKDRISDMPDISIFDELPSFDLTPKKTPSGSRGKRKLTTPSRAVPCPDWLSPIRGLTPFKFGDDFTNLKEDLNVTPPRTGLTPKNRYGTISLSAAACGLSTPKSHRSPALGSLGDLGLSGLTPERIGEIHNQSFGKIFGGDLSFDMDSEGFWSMMSPTK